MRRQTHGGPLAPAMTAEKRVDVTPLPSMRSRQRQCGGFDAAGFPQGNNAVPALVGDGLLALFVVRAALGQPQDLTLILRANRVLQVQRTQGGHHARMFALIGQTMRLTRPLALEGNRLQWHQDVTQEQDDSGPRMTDDLALAVMERWGIFRVQTSAVLQWTVDEDQDLPGQPVASCERLGQRPGLCVGETLPRGRRHLRMRLQPVRKEGRMQAGKPGGLFESMLWGDDHQKEQRTGAHPRKPLTDSDPTCDPSLYGASEHRASPRGEHAEMGGGDDSIGQGSGCPSLFVKEVMCGIPGTASL